MLRSKALKKKKKGCWKLWQDKSKERVEEDKKRGEKIQGSEKQREILLREPINVSK